MANMDPVNNLLIVGTTRKNVERNPEHVWTKFLNHNVDDEKYNWYRHYRNKADMLTDLKSEARSLRKKKEEERIRREKEEEERREKEEEERREYWKKEIRRVEEEKKKRMEDAIKEDNERQEYLRKKFAYLQMRR